jgi:hypothetical protein
LRSSKAGHQRLIATKVSIEPVESNMRFTIEMQSKNTGFQESMAFEFGLPLVLLESRVENEAR